VVTFGSRAPGPRQSYYLGLAAQSSVDMTERSTTHVSTSRPEPTLAEFGYGLRTEGVPLPWEVHVFHARARRAEVAKYEVSLRYALDSADLRTQGSTRRWN